jgi:hypothetical protein
LLGKSNLISARGLAIRANIGYHIGNIKEARGFTLKAAPADYLVKSSLNVFADDEESFCFYMYF